MRDCSVSNIIIINTRHQLSLDRPVTSKSNSTFKGLPSRLRPFSLYFSIIFAILLLHVVTSFIYVRLKRSFYLNFLVKVLWRSV
jgi:hypothetical protein